jgi:predicted nucleic acid-binding protein
MPTGKQQIIYWDTCIFLAWMKDEKRGPGEMEGLKKVADLVSKDQVILITSMLTRAEILESKLKKGVLKLYDAITRRSNVVPNDLDLPIAVLTSKIRDYYLKTDFELLTPDAIHLATAIHYNADEFHTFDGTNPRPPRNPKKYKRCGLLLLDGNVAGYPMKVCKPTADQYELGLKPTTP